jgi:hypothetical protein
MAGKPKRVEQSKNPEIQRRQLKSNSPPDDDHEEKQLLNEAFSKLTSDSKKHISPKLGPQ